MDAEERKEFEESRADLIDNAWIGYGVKLGIRSDDKVYIRSASLSDVVEFYQDYRSEIEEVI